MNRDARTPHRARAGPALVVYNPLAGGGRGEAAARLAARHLEQSGVAVATVPTRPNGGARDVTAEQADRSTFVVAVGGDGTLREVVEGLKDARERVSVGVVPMGNANIVARELGIPMATDEAVAVLVDGEPTPVDVGTLRLGGREELFLAVVGVGWDADTVRLVDHLRHTALGRTAYRLWADGLYGVAGATAALRRPPRLTVEVDDAALSDRPFAAVLLANLRSYGKGMVSSPDAHHASGRIHVQARRSGSPVALGRQLSAALRARHAPVSVAVYADGRTITVRSGESFAVQVDGDARGEVRELSVGVVPAGVHIVAPKSA